METKADTVGSVIVAVAMMIENKILVPFIPRGADIGTHIKYMCEARKLWEGGNNIGFPK